MEPSTAHPRVSVIVATYNRSNVLALAIRSVLAQTFRDWELWVIGDSCTDDTQAVVQGFADPRIHFVNLAVNYGNQYGPNNEGMRRAQGRYFAFLNHDDLWLPDHLEISVSEIETTKADLVFTLSEIVEPGGDLRLSNASPTGKYEPYLVVPASAWLFRRELFKEIGPWSSPDKIYKAPSQDWLCRAWQAKIKMLSIPRLTVVAIESGARIGVYAQRAFEENFHYFQYLVQDPSFREKELTRLASSPSVRLAHALKWNLIQAIKRVIFRLGFHPQAFYNFFLFPGRGGFVKRLRKKRGIDSNAVSRKKTSIP